MNKRKSLFYLGNFLNDTKRERILFELHSKKKKEIALSKITAFSECFKDNNMFCDLTHFQEREALQKLEQTKEKSRKRLFSCIKKNFTMNFKKFCPHIEILTKKCYN